jgi:hypothetical protein
MAKKKAPKSIGGIKIPKRLRKSGFVASVLAHPSSRIIMAEILVAAAGAAAAAMTRHKVAAAMEDNDRPNDGENRHEPMRAAAGALGGALSEFARSVVSDANGSLSDRTTKKSKKKKRKRAEQRGKAERWASSSTDRGSRH